MSARDNLGTDVNKPVGRMGSSDSEHSSGTSGNIPERSVSGRPITGTNNRRAEAPLTPQKLKIISLFEEPGEIMGIKAIMVRLRKSQPTIYQHIEGRDGLLALGLLKKFPDEYPSQYSLTELGAITYRNSLIGGIGTNNLLENNVLCDMDSPKLNGGSRKTASVIGCPSKNSLVVRGHDIRLRIDLVRADYEILFNGPKFSDVKSVGLVNWTKRSARFEGDSFYLTRNCLVFQPKEQYGEPYEVFFNVYASCRNLVKELEAQNSPGLKFKDDYIFVLGQEWAFEHDAFAEVCYKLQEKIHNARFHVDFSKGFPELEFHDKEEGVENASKYARFVDDLIDGRTRSHLLEAERLAHNEFCIFSVNGTVEGILSVLGNVVTCQKQLATAIEMGGLTVKDADIRILSGLQSALADAKALRDGFVAAASASPSVSVPVNRSRLDMSSRELYDLRRQTLDK